jgi:hypothetical protein
MEGKIMTQRTRILIAAGVLILLVAAVLGIDAWQRSSAKPPAEGEPTVAPGAIPICLDGKPVGSFTPTDLERLEKVSFVEPEEGKTQEGWLLRDVIRLYVEPDKLDSGTLVTVSSSSRDKSAQVTWAEVDHVANYVMFDLSNRGTLKLVSVLPSLDTRDEWVQDVDSIEVATP